MMIFTHILIGILLSAGAAQLSAAPVSYFLIAGAAGGLFPDIDMVFTHRKTLHYPYIFSILTIISLPVYSVVQSGPLLVFITFMAAAAAHSVMDMLGGGKEMRPWRETDNRAVYNHLQQRWIRPRRIFYDGSLPDLFISVVSAVAILYIVSAEVDFWIMLLLGLAVIYTLFRRVITRWIPEEYATFSSYIQNKIM